MDETKTERLLIQLTVKQKRFIEKKSKQTHKSQARIVREAINKYIERRE